MKLRFLLSLTALAFSTGGLAAMGYEVPAKAQPVQTPAIADLADVVIPRPNLSAMQEGPRNKIESVQLTLRDLLDQGDREASELAEGFGFLGQLFHSFEKLDAAETSYETAHRLAPEEARWPYYLGLIRNSKGDLQSAVEHYRSALRNEPERLWIAVRLANALLDLGRLEEARIHFERVEKQSSDNVAAVHGLGRIADLQGEHDRSIELFQRVLALQPEATSVHYALAQAFRSSGDLESAKLHLNLRGDGQIKWSDPLVEMLGTISVSSTLEVVANLAADTENFSEESFLGFALSQLRNTPGAVAQLSGMVERLSESGRGTKIQLARMQYAIGGLLVGVGRDGDAIAHFEKAVAGDPSLRDAHVKLGNVLARNGHLKPAVEAFDRALELHADDATVLGKRATALVNLERFEEARADLERAVASDPDNLENWRLLARAQERSTGLEAAVESLKRGIEGSPDTPPDSTRTMALHTELGDLYRRWQRYESSARAYLEALRIDQGYVPALSRLASLLGQLGEFERAAEVYGKWIARQPSNVESRVGEATALILAGRFAIARQRLEASIAEFPQSLDLRDILARHLAACPDPSVRDGERAVELARDLYRELPTLESLETLAMALAEAGQFDEASRRQQTLLQAEEDEIKVEQRQRWRANLKRYESGQACCAAGPSGG